MRATLVCGPPAAGKTTYVQRHAARGDLILDVDALAAALSGLPQHDKPDAIVPYALAARDAVLDRLASHNTVRHAWVVAGLPRAVDRRELADRLNADVVVLETSAAECVRRLARARRPAAGVHAAINRWWQEYEPSERDRRVPEEGTW